jgi:hypothetical protein
MRFYFTEQGVNRGFYLGPYIKYQQMRRIYSDASLNENSSGVGGGLTLGYQWVRQRGFVMDVFLGGGYFLISSPFEKTDSTAPPTDSRIGFSLGYGFKRK